MTAPRRRYAILADGWFANRHAKTAHGLIRYGGDEVACVIDSTLAGRRVSDVMSNLHEPARGETPIVAGLREALELRPTSILVGLAPAGGRLPEEWMRTLREAAAAGLEIVSGLHQRLAPELPGAKVWDVREPPEGLPIFSGEGFGIEPVVATAVGTSSAIGKMTAVLEIQRAAIERGTRAEFVPTGQTGAVIAGWGICIDAVVSDFAAGASERLVLEAATRSPDLILVEGQGSIAHPAYSGVTTALLHGSCPDCLILCADAHGPEDELFPGVPFPEPKEISPRYEELAALVKPAPVVAVSVNTSALGDAEAEALVERIATETGLPTADPVRGDATPILDALLKAPKTRPAAR
ncbi:DUF1611 domain-containing protein [Rubrobacter marinus]|uniref:DUF1611 domain-containing protein n=1 Tax=Rubrobacter marinus TaxID=2653852 RepID=A0A6G8PTC8_9ACTN|nr:DUF1611 domain-containing protein [Rubrobacter marinus]QIN77583.1 DUF1611 domain-containing protein [Rubrobacter marinus]